MAADPPPEPDAAPGAPHPRLTSALFGQQAAEAAFLDAWAGGRLPHAWLICGPRGIGKATLAWRIARFLLSGPDPDAQSLDVDPDTPVARRLAALSEPRLFLLRRTPHPDTGRMRNEITIDGARRLKGFLQMAAPDEGWRAIIVDAAEEMTISAANALLKLLEEPPARTVLLLVCHAPARLLPTIRSRCRTLTCAPLGPPDMEAALDQAGTGGDTDAIALAQLTAGSVGAAVRLLAEDGPRLYADLVRLMADMPRAERARMIGLADGVAGAAGAARFDTLTQLIDLILSRLARHGAGLPPTAEAAEGETAMLARLAPHSNAGRAWADLQQSQGARLRRGRAVNLDPAALILDTTLAMEETAKRVI